MIDTSGFPAPKDAPPSGACVRLERPEPGLALIVLDPPHRSLPVLDLPLLRDLDLRLEEVERDASITALVVTGRDPRTFAAGADLDALGSLTDAATVRRLVRTGQELFERIAALSRTRRGFRSVAAVGGAVPGGACELALACDLIVLADAKETKIGLPETQLGILPAWGGATRLPRRIGVPKALEAILAGKLYTPREALRMGIVDRLAAPEDLVRIATDVALRRMLLERRSRGWKGVLVDANPVMASFIASQARARVLARTKGRYPAPLVALEIVARAPRRSVAASFEAEADAAAALAVGPVAKNLIRIFRLSEEAKKLERLPDGSRALRIERAGVIGAGVMGRGIASSLASKGVWTRLNDMAGDALDVALLEHRFEVAEKRKKRRLDATEAVMAIDRLDAERDLGGLARSQIVIEAVAERLEVKRSVFGHIAARAPADTILATNTSSLSVAAIAEGLPNPERVVGLHFFNPVKRMPLVEIVRAPKTDPRVVAACAALVLKLGKTPVVVADRAGFLVNRLLGPYLDEALRLFEAGVPAESLERAVKAFGMPMGPLELLDEVGFDIAAHAAVSLHTAFGARMQPTGVLARMTAEKRLGKKSGAGFYLHGAGKPRLDPALARFADGAATRVTLASDTEIAERVVLAMLAEAARALEEQIVAGPRELDLATVFGMGFPPFHGGLTRWADALGTRTVVEKLERIAALPDVANRAGGRERFEPCALLRDLARTNRPFDGYGVR